jgi:4'-phosphopantetheinyl transferase EntD
VTIGLDAEPHDELPDGVLDAVSLAPERERVAELTAAVPGVCWDRLLFCVKESVYKAWFPLTGRWLGFEEACVDFDPASQDVHRAAAGARPGRERQAPDRVHRPLAG